MDICGVGLFANKAKLLEEALENPAVNAGNSRSAGAGSSSHGHTIFAAAQVRVPCSLLFAHRSLALVWLFFGLI
jgi:hypothetical protein